MRDQRTSARYDANRQVLIRWDNSDVIPARLDNYSRGGASIQARVRPPRIGKLFVCIEDGSQTSWLEATIVKVTRVGVWFRRGPFRIQIKFPDGCTYDFFRELAAEFVTEPVLPPIEPSYDHWWR